MTKHNIEPVYNQDSRILILGSFPSVKSREAKFFYHQLFVELLLEIKQLKLSKNDFEDDDKKTWLLLIYGMLLKVVTLKDQVIQVLPMLKSMI